MSSTQLSFLHADKLLDLHCTWKSMISSCDKQATATATPVRTCMRELCFVDSVVYLDPSPFSQGASPTNES